MLINELRTGNLLMKGGQWVIVDGQIIRDIAHLPGENERYTRIPLSAALLERCGFRNGSILVSNDVGWAFKLETIKGEIVLTAGECALPVSCTYLHQLQNLFYVLSGEELSIAI